jgi:DNA-binding NarL/FixJ family response regulator
MTSMPEHSFLQKAQDCGCDGFWYKEYGDAELLDVCGRVMAGRAGLAGGARPPCRWAAPAAATSPIGSWPCCGSWLWAAGTRRSPRTLGITANTVKYHIKNLLQKTGYRSTLQLVVDVVDKKLILPKY